MAEIRYIHAADLHLDAAYAGLSHVNASPALIRLIQESTFIALERLVRLCEEQRPDFLVLAGDIYNREDASIKAQLKLREACKRLDALDIPVYIAHGNRDPFSSGFQSLKFPPNVHIFSAEAPNSFEFRGTGNKRALIHGISHAQDPETRNLSALFQRKAGDAAFQLAVLHCSVENVAQNDNIAPCALSDLKNTGMDAWALGHVHDRTMLCEKPFIAYPGNSQGLCLSETGDRGCLLVRAIKEENGWRCSPEFHSLAPVLWQKLHLNLDHFAAPNELENLLEKLLIEKLADVAPSVSAIIASLSISGRTSLNTWLRKDERLADMRALFNNHSSARLMLALNDIELETRDEENWQEYMAREDLLGETMRVYADLAENPIQFKELCAETLAPLLKYPQLAGLIQDKNEAELLDLLYQAENLCMDILEKR